MFIDTIFFEFVHFLCEIGGDFFTPLFVGISFFGINGWLFVLLACILMLRKKTRWIGVTIGFTMLFSVIAEKILKELIARPRPYISDAANLYQYWQMAGAIEKEGFSMPSGHVLAVAAFFFGYAISAKKENRKMVYIIGFICMFIMTIARCYLFHHHLTDCLLSIIIAFVLSYFGKFVAKLVYILCKKLENIWLFNFVLNFDFFELFAPKRSND